MHWWLPPCPPPAPRRHPPPPPPAQVQESGERQTGGALVRLGLFSWTSTAALGISDPFFFLPLGSVQKTTDQNSCLLRPIL